VDDLVILSRFVHFAALCYLAGGALFRLAVAPMSPTRGRWIATSVLALISALGWLAGVAAEMAGGLPELLAPDTLIAVLTETRFGQLWCLRLALLLAMVTIAFTQPGRRSDILMLGLAGVALASLAGTGHGVAGSGPLWIVHVVADATHLLCAAAWLGGLASVGLLLRSDAMSANGERSPAMTPNALPRFSRLGYGAVAALLLTGCINTALLVPSPDLLLTGEYGRLLIVKLTLVVAMVAIAIVNRLVLAPRLRSKPARLGGALRTLRRSVAVEQVTGLAVLAVVALLGTIHPGQ
jgi:putative copper resistance protein D